MIIAVSSRGNDLNAEIDPRFGRCQYFIFLDTDTMEFEAVLNEAMNTMGGAGIKAAQMVAEKGAGAAITGNVGPNAYQTLSAAGVKIYTGASGFVKDVVERFKRGELTETSGASVGSHFGMGQGQGMGRGMGQGRGAGRGMGGR